MSDLLEALLRSEKTSEKPSPASPASPKSSAEGEAGEAGDNSSPKFASAEAERPSSPCAIRGCSEHDKPALLPEGPRTLDRYPEKWHTPMPLRRCGALICKACGALRPSQHRDDCAFRRFEPCGSPCFWLSPHGAVKCCACEPPTNLALAEAWVLAREDEGYRVPPEILAILHVTQPGSIGRCERH